MLAEPSTNRPTSDPYDNPILGALRNKRFAESTGKYVSSSHEHSVAYKGDCSAVGWSEEGARKLANAILACFSKERLIPQTTRIIMPQNGSDTPQEFDISIGFPREKAMQVNATIDKINAAARAAQLRQQSRTIR